MSDLFDSKFRGLRLVKHDEADSRRAELPHAVIVPEREATQHETDASDDPLETLSDDGRSRFEKKGKATTVLCFGTLTDVPLEQGPRRATLQRLAVGAAPKPRLRALPKVEEIEGFQARPARTLQFILGQDAFTIGQVSYLLQHCDHLAQVPPDKWTAKSFNKHLRELVATNVLQPIQLDIERKATSQLFALEHVVSHVSCAARRLGSPSASEELAQGLEPLADHVADAASRTVARSSPLLDNERRELAGIFRRLVLHRCEMLRTGK